MVAAVSLGVGIGFHFAGTKAQKSTQAEPAAEQTIAPATNTPAPNTEVAKPAVTPRQSLPRTNRTAVAEVIPNPVPIPNFEDAAVFKQILDSLVSPQTAYADKQAMWKQLKDSGRLNQVISALEQKTTDGSGSADSAATLGQAYLKKCATTDDVRQQGIFAMRADEVFDTALGQDSSNWDARFYKAVSLSYWPAQMNKSQEVIDNFQTLIQQQETHSPQPQYALPYLWLGDQYQKAGSADLAAQTWQRGMALFPENAELKNRIAGKQ